MTLEKTGIPSKEQIDAAFPSDERLAQGPVAVIECFQSIPCNPCQTACRRNAVQPFADINDLPGIIAENCNGCGLCVSRCPGLAIMVVDMTYSPDKALIKLPYEFNPLPRENAVVTALNRAGEPVCDALVVRVQNAPAQDKTAVIWLAADKGFVREVRNFKIKENPGKSIVCRCNDLDIEQVRELIAQGFTSVDEIKRVSRLGMGPCQGRNCIPLVLNELAKATGKPVSELDPGTYRPVVKSVPLGAVADYGSAHKDEEHPVEGGLIH